MPEELKTVAVQVFAAPSASHRAGVTWEAATAFLRQRLGQRFGGAAEVEHIEMFTPRSFEFPDVLNALESGGALPIVRVGGQIVSQGEKLSEHRISAAISALLSDRRQSKMALTREDVATEANLTVAVNESARSLAHAVAHSEAYRRFEAAQEAFMADRPLRARIDELQARAQQLRVARMWGGTDAAQEEALQQELDSLADVPTLRDFFVAQEELRTLLQGVTKKITEEIGVDYGAACSPAGGCC